MKRKSALRSSSSSRSGKRVRFVADSALVVVLGPEGATAQQSSSSVAASSSFQFATLKTVSTKAVTPLFNIPTTANRNAKKKLWGESWPSPATPSADDDDDDDDDYETVLEWFCDECQSSIHDDSTRYECAVCPADYCRCVSCYRASVVAGQNRHDHPLTPSTKPYHISSQPKASA